jgi:hypothetical protein
MRIEPAADATAVSSSQKQAKAKAVFDIAAAKPNGFDQYQVTKRLLEAMDVDSLETLYPDPKGPKAIAPIPNPKLEIEKAKLQQKQKQHEDQMSLDVAELQNTIALAGAKITELEAKATKELAEAKGVETGHAIALIDAQMSAEKNRKDSLMRVLDTLLKVREGNRKHDFESTKLGVKNAEPGAEG